MPQVRLKRNTWYLIDRSQGQYLPIRLGTKAELSRSDVELIKAKYVADSTYLRLKIQKDSNITLEEIIPIYLKAMAPDKKKTTLEGEEIKLNRWARDFGKRRLKSLTEQEVRDFTSHRSPNYRRLLILAMRSLFKFAIENQYVSQNPTDKVKLPKIPRLPPKAVDPREIDLVLNAMRPGTRERFDVALYTAMRPGELSRMKVRDINFKQNIITIPETKNGKFRSIPMHSKIRPILKGLVRDRGPNETIFTTMFGKPVKDFRNSLRHAANKVGVKVTPYTFRHQFATELLNSEIPKGMSFDQYLVVLKEILGHSTLEMVLRYARIKNTTTRKVMDHFNRDT